jgi:5-methylcytosine-specific restriction enzyme A
MPTQTRRPCTWPRCPNRAAPGDFYCKRHGGEREARRGTPAERGYGSAWRRLAAAVLADEPYCRMCVTAGRGCIPATDVDHILPKAEGGTDERHNLRPLCHDCHSRHTALTRTKLGCRDASI